MRIEPALLWMAFSAGVVTFFNPCGFALLPAYYSYLLEGKGRVNHSVGRATLRILKIGALASAGFLTVLLFVGAVVSGGGYGWRNSCPGCRLYWEVY